MNIPRLISYKIFQIIVVHVSLKRKASTFSMENLTVDQQRALNQLRVLTNGADDDVAMGVLDSVDWDVQVPSCIYV
jgi:hypothetical protein